MTFTTALGATNCGVSDGSGLVMRTPNWPCQTSTKKSPPVSERPTVVPAASLKIIPSRTYGHEDTVFGGALAAAGLSVGHLDNPVLHLGLEPAPVFRQKTVEAVANLVRLAQASQPGATASGLWRLAQQLHRTGAAGVTRHLLSALEPRLLRNLDSGAPSLYAFDAWRLLLTLRLIGTAENTR